MIEIAKIFLRLGCTSFGGPLVAFTMMEDEVVRRHKWMSSENFSKTLALTKILPGPTASQLAVQLGRMQGGRLGGLISGFCFTLPSFLLVMILGVSLNFWAASPHKDQFSLGLGLAALAVIVQGMTRMFRAQIKSVEGYVVSLIAGIFVFIAPGLEPLLIVGFGLLGLILFYWRGKILEASTLLVLIYVALKAAVFSFGTGLAIIPLLQSTVVEKLKLISQKDFLEALVLGQITPGPVMMSVSWMGYKAAGLWGSLVSTFFVFLPGFLICLFFIPWFEKKTDSIRGLKSFYEWAIFAVIGSMIAVTLKLFAFHLSKPTDYAIFVSALILLFWKNTPSWFVIPLFGFIELGLSKWSL